MKRCAKCDYDYEDVYDGCPRCAHAKDQPAESSTLEARVVALEQSLSRDWRKWAEDLGKRVADIETWQRRSDVYSHEFWPRAWAIFGHNMSIGAIVYVIFLVAIFCVTAASQ